MNILVTLDANYLEPLCHLLRSLQKTHPNRELHVYVAHASLTAEHFQKIQNAVGAQNKVFNICVSEDMLKDAPVLKRITKSTYYRLFAAAYLPKDVDRVLYIDPDTWCCAICRRFTTSISAIIFTPAAVTLAGFAISLIPQGLK